jgi:hypothetical protein
MVSLNAKNVAIKVSENIRKGKKVNLGKIILENGYSKSTSEAPQRVTETDSYKEALDPIVDEWKKERNRLTKSLAKRNLDNEEYRTVLAGIDIITKNIQLLSGKDTEKITVSNEFKLKSDEALDELLNE